MATNDAAIAMVESIINGDVIETTYTDEVVVQRIATDYLPLKNGPVVTVDEVTIGDETSALSAAAANGYTVERFGIRRKYPYTWPVGKITVTYDAGWASSASYPTAISEAITILEDVINAKPGLNAAKIEVGDEAVWFREPDGGKVAAPAAVYTLLRKWIKRDA